MNEKIGLAVITYNRPDYFKQCMESLKKYNYGGADYIIVVEDCSDPEYEDAYNLVYHDLYKDAIPIIRHLFNRGVAVSKNDALEELLNKGCTHLFLMEDDILMNSKNTCKNYIDYCKIVKRYMNFDLKHLNFALHGPMNKGRKSTHEGICVYPNCVGAFSYYHKDVIEKVGLLDEEFKNAWEHVEHTYRIIQAGFHPPFWKFADVPISDKLLKEIPGSIDSSSIRPRDDWKQNIDQGQLYWIRKHGSWLPSR